MKSRTQTLLAGAALVMIAQASAHGQTVETTGSWEQPYGATGQQNQPYQGGLTGRDENGNRIIVDGLMQTGVGGSTQHNSEGGVFGGGVGSSATAIGNQLNVNVVGSWNTVVVNSVQTNNGDVNANSQSSVPNEDNPD